jgi:hypothetical protein
MEMINVLVIGGGAAGYFGAITAAQAKPDCRVLLVERGPQPLSKVRISGGGRCNVTHACFEPRPLSARYPRGARALLSAFSRFQPADTVQWFEKRGVLLKTEADGRMFPTTDRSQTITECLEHEALTSGVEVRVRCGAEQLRPLSGGGWEVILSGTHGGTVHAERVLIATGGWRSGTLANLIESLGHEIALPVPSLFTFHLDEAWVRELSGLAVPVAEVSVPNTSLKERGPVLFTHWGLSGPAILKLSAWGARELHQLDYHFSLRVRWCADHTEQQLLQTFQEMRQTNPAKSISNTPLFQIPSRLWERLLLSAEIRPEERWNRLTRHAALTLADRLLRHDLQVIGKSMHKDEFVTCGGVRLKDIDFKTMESRICSGLYFAGEVLDLDGITGGFNFQAAWTTGWIAGQAMSQSVSN